jgi:hypothetical protein
MRKRDMPNYIFLMHDDAPDVGDDWEPYLTKLKASGSFEGGSAIGVASVSERKMNRRR